MQLRFDARENAWRTEISEFVASWVTAEALSRIEAQEEASSYPWPEFSQALGQKGWLSLHWPKEYGGQERPITDLVILNEELGKVRAPIGWHNVATEWVANPLLEYGTEEQKRRFLPRIAAGQASYAPTLSEPDAGSDLAALTTRAVRDGDNFVINGAKAFITPAHRAEYLWLLARTDPNSKRHEGLSVFIVETAAEGVEITRVPTINFGRVNDVFLNDVRVPSANLVGGVNEGWKVAMTTLNIERSGIYYVALRQAMLRELIAFASNTDLGGQRLIDDLSVKRGLGAWVAELEAQRMLSYRVAWRQAKGFKPSVEPAVQNLREKSTEYQFADFVLSVVTCGGVVTVPDDAGSLERRAVRAYLSASAQHAGGTTEIQKTIVARRGLEL